MAETLHIGRKISRMRELLGMKQETLAAELGISQQPLSQIEQIENLEEEALERIAKKLGVSSEAIKSYNDEAVVNYFNSYDNSSNGYHYNCNFNPLDKLLEVVEKNEKLYESLLQSEKNELLKQR